MTNKHRRNFIKRSLCLLAVVTTGMAGMLKPLLAFAERNSKAFSAET